MMQDVGIIIGHFEPLHLGHVRTILHASGQVKDLYIFTQHTTKKRKSLLKQWHNNNFSHEPPLCQTLTDSVKY